MSGHSQAGPPADPAAAAAEQQQRLSRRSMLRGAGASAAGLAAIAVAGPAAPALAAASRPAAPARGGASADGSSDGMSEPVVVHLRDVRSGEMDFFAGTSQVRLRDPDLAARLARASRASR
jgi:hypothetical protein